MYYDYTSSRNHLVEMPKNGRTMRSREKPSVGMKRVLSSIVNITPYPIPAIVRFAKARIARTSSNFSAGPCLNVIPPDHDLDVPVVEPNQHDDAPVVPEPVLEDEDEDPKEDECEEEEDPQEDEDDMEIKIEEDKNRIMNKEPLGEERKMIEPHVPQPVSHYLKHKINKELIEGLAENQRFNDSLLVMQLGKMECEDYHSLPKEPMCKLFCKFKEREEDKVDPLSIINERILEWEERIKFHREKELEFN
ncbi:hypothetical protein Tco_1376945 [Tanacetum coccineum]